MRYIVEAYCSVLDTKTGLRVWFNSLTKALTYASAMEVGDYASAMKVMETA